MGSNKIREHYKKGHEADRYFKRFKAKNEFENDAVWHFKTF
jgi:hypothetical protein